MRNEQSVTEELHTLGALLRTPLDALARERSVSPEMIQRVVASCESYGMYLATRPQEDSSG